MAVCLKEIPFRSIPGIRLGHAQNIVGGTGCTAIICEGGAVAGCDVRGGGPATHETDLLRPENMVQQIHSVLLTGGSAYGLEACAGVMEGLEARGVGFDVGVAVVPIVCGAALFDLYCGDPKCRPNRTMGREACEDAYNDDDQSNEQDACLRNLSLSGNLGAGTGAAIGKLAGIKNATKGGIGVYAVELNGIIMGAVVAVNAVGDVVDIDGSILGGMRNSDGLGFTNSEQYSLQTLLNPSSAFKTPHPSVAITNTTIGCVVTNARLSKGECTKLAGVAHDSLARCIRPVHTNADGDSLFVLSTSLGVPSPNFTSLTVLANQVLENAIRRAIMAASAAFGLPSALEVKAK